MSNVYIVGVGSGYRRAEIILALSQLIQNGIDVIHIDSGIQIMNPDGVEIMNPGVKIMNPYPPDRPAHCSFKKERTYPTLREGIRRKLIK